MVKIPNKDQRVTKFENLRIQKEHLEHHTQGSGWYRYSNNTKGTLTLPIPTKAGQKTIPVNGKWEGNDYYMCLVRSNDARIVEQLISPEKEKQMQEEKLILDQPATVTTEGAVEHVVKGAKPAKKGAKPKKNLTEQPELNPEDVLLTEDPLDGITILG